MQYFSRTNTTVPVNKRPPADKKKFVNTRLKLAREAYQRKQIQKEVVPDPGTLLTAPLTDRILASL